MSHSAASPAPDQSPVAPSAPDTRLRGRWLLLARVGWVAVAGLALALFMGGLPAYFAEIETVCRPAACTYDQLTPDALQQLRALGPSLDFFAWYELVLNGLVALLFVAVGLVIFWRKAADPTALVAAFTLLTLSTSFTDVTRALPAPLVAACPGLGLSGLHRRVPVVLRVS